MKKVLSKVRSGRKSRGGKAGGSDGDASPRSAGKAGRDESGSPRSVGSSRSTGQAGREESECKSASTGDDGSVSGVGSGQASGGVSSERRRSRGGSASSASSARRGSASSALPPPASSGTAFSRTGLPAADATERDALLGGGDVFGAASSSRRGSRGGCLKDGGELDDLDLESMPPLSNFGGLGLGLDEGVVHMDSSSGLNVGFGGHSPPGQQATGDWAEPSARPPADVFQLGHKSLRRYVVRRRALRSRESSSEWLAALLTESKRLREECLRTCCPSEPAPEVGARVGWQAMARLRAAAADKIRRGSSSSTTSALMGLSPREVVASRGDYGSAGNHTSTTSGAAFGFGSVAAVAADGKTGSGSTDATSTGGMSALSTEQELLAQAARLHVVMERSQQAFDDNDPAHLALLLKVWSLGLKSDLKMEHGTSKQGSSKSRPVNWRASEEWKKLGFQHVDPVTDLRGGGMLALHNIAYMFELYPHVPRVMNEKHLLCAATSVNMTVILLHHLKLAELPPLAEPTDAEDAGATAPNPFTKHNTRRASSSALLTKSSSRPSVRFLDASAKPTSADNTSTAIAPVEERIHMYRATQLDAMYGLINMVARCPDDQAVLDLFSALVATGMMLVVNGWRELSRDKPSAPTLLDFSVILYSARIHLIHLLSADPRTVATLQSWASGIPAVLIDPELGIP